MRVLGIVEQTPTGAHASDLWRIVRPFYELARRGHDAVCVVGASSSAVARLRPHVHVIPRQCKTPRDRIRRYVDQCHELYSAVVVDWDDTPDLHDRARNAPDAAEVERGAWDWIECADAVTCTTPALQSYLALRAKRAYFLPNLIAPELWQHSDPPSRPLGLTIGVQGGDSHGQDWRILAWLWPRLAQIYPDLHFVVVGWCPDYLAGVVPAERFHFLPWTSYRDHPIACRYIDIGLAPLAANDWNRYKSPIKWLEYTLAGAAVVASDTMYGDWIRHGETGLIARTPDEWLGCCRYLIDSGSARKRLREQARADVLANFTFTDQACSRWWATYQYIYAEVFGVLPNDELAYDRNGRLPSRVLA